MKVPDDLPDLDGIRILVLDDDPAIQRSLARALRGLGGTVVTAGGLREAGLLLETGSIDVVLADLKLKNGTGLDLLPEFQKRYPEGLFYLITGHGSVDSAVTALKHGVRDYLQKPVDPIALARRLQRDIAARSPSCLENKLDPYLLFQDPVMDEALADIPRFAALDEPVLIGGETGTGKELVAMAIHRISPRSTGPFVAVNCGAIPESMLESELFGHERGAFTGASGLHHGRFEQASGGTLFLDEIGEMPLQFQVRLLRVLEERTIQRLGGEKPLPVDVRIVAATHRDLHEDVEAGLFRRDLFYRLDVLQIQLPPLRQRKQDITLLADHFLRRTLEEIERHRRAPLFTPEAQSLLSAYSWPGNIRELRNQMTRLAVRLPDDIREISADFLRSALPAIRHTPDCSSGETICIPASATLAEAEKILIDAALKRANFNRKKAARLLGIGERTLRRRLNEK
ncbi:MAG TPA: sigma-54-dependent Fis family transcriptional regulator [Desulfobulbus sp.]|nr:sigma-54-dependent Fis family transcriptional regulator [Desulfobulbus sp.]